uniref:Putative secreted protein n=1 Tax=Anopheles triannulatus TaxID=58253 RepID=A0A2M4B7F1_9DIPT
MLYVELQLFALVLLGVVDVAHSPMRLGKGFILYPKALVSLLTVLYLLLQIEQPVFELAVLGQNNQFSTRPGRYARW